MGRYGGDELSYASDLDLVLAYDGGTADDQLEADRIARRLIAIVGPVGPDRMYEVDLSLRPDGNSGQLARSLNGYRLYLERWAAIWERQAMVRARVAAGDEVTGRGFVLATAPVVWATEPTTDQLDEIRHIHGRIGREKMPRGIRPAHHLKVGPGGLVDIEFAVQMRQLITGARGQNTLAALDNLARRGWLTADDAETLSTAYRAALTMRNRLSLLGSRTPDVVPTEGPWLHKLAVSLDIEPDELVAEHDDRAAAAEAVTSRLIAEA
jgi:glutamate-ammonia-ligase adenylyltransferase